MGSDPTRNVFSEWVFSFCVFSVFIPLFLINFIIFSSSIFYFIIFFSSSIFYFINLFFSFIFFFIYGAVICSLNTPRANVQLLRNTTWISYSNRQQYQKSPQSLSFFLISYSARLNDWRFVAPSPLRKKEKKWRRKKGWEREK